MGGVDALQPKTKFDPQGKGFDMDTARKFGMRPSTESGPNFGHMGSVVPSSAAQQKQFGIPENSFMILKGRGHPTFSKAVAAENRRGFEVKQLGTRFFSVPKPGKLFNE